MAQGFLNKMVEQMGREHTTHRLNVMTAHLVKAQNSTSKETASVIDDVISLLVQLQKEL